VTQPGANPGPGFVVRNIGHGPALFVEFRPCLIRTQANGVQRVHLSRLGLVEPGKAEQPVATFDPMGNAPIGYSIFIDSLWPQEPRATADQDIAITSRMCSSARS